MQTEMEPSNLCVSRFTIYTYLLYMVFLCPDCTMGLLTVGRPLSWEESKKYADKVRHDGVAQFIAAYKRLRDRKDDELKFGDEVRVWGWGGVGCWCAFVH